MNIIQKLGQGLSYIMMFGCALWALGMFADVLFKDTAGKKITRK